MCCAVTVSAIDVQPIIEGIINWKKADNGSSADGYLINDAFLEQAGTTPGDWFPIGLGRYGYKDNLEGYLAVIKEEVARRYQTAGKLHPAKATEWHRIGLAVLAAGGDPENVNGINLVKDGVYDRGKTASLGRQGINGWIWGLILLDSMRYPVPEGAYYTRDDIIVEILRQQLADGGFALSGKNADPDISAMAVQALAPYYNNETVYTYTSRKSGEQVRKSVRMVVDETLAVLSQLQTDDGDYFSWGTQNVESTAQTAVALCSLGIDPQTDKRFIKNGHTLLDGIMKYRMADGGFTHSYANDENNTSAVAGQSNTMASEQVLYTLVAYYRYQNNMRTLYDFRREQPAEIKNQIRAVTEKINAVSQGGAAALLEEYNKIPPSERSYVYNYHKLSDMYKLSKGEEVYTVAVPRAAGNTAAVGRIDPNAEFSTGEASGEYKVEGNEPTEDAAQEEQPQEQKKIVFDEKDMQLYLSLPQNLTTENYVTVIQLIDKLEQAEELEGKADILAKLKNAKQKILDIKAEIENINSEVLDKLYPFEKISVKDRKTVHDIVRRINALSEYDRTKILRYEDIYKTLTQVDNLYRAIIISAVAVVIITLMGIYVFLRFKKRKKMKLYNSMLAEQSEYEDIGQ